jgi:N4-gp56 family major capsid protein
VKYRQFADARDAGVAKNKGDIFHWNIYSDIQTQGGQILESAVVPESNFEITQGQLTITEFANSVPFTSKLDDLSEHSVKEIINQVLKNDAKKAFDNEAYVQFNASPLVVTPIAGTSLTDVVLSTTGVPAAANDAPLTKAHVRAIVNLMKERNIPAYTDDDYFSIGHPSTYEPFAIELEAIHQYVESGHRKIMNGEKGRYNNVRFIEQTHIAKENWASGKSNQAHFFGSDTVVEGIAVPEQLRGKIPTDFGRSKGIAWYYLGGFGIVHTDPVQARIVKWGSTG